MTARYESCHGEAFVFPTNLPQWPEIRAALHNLRQEHSTSEVILSQLQNIYSVVHSNYLPETDADHLTPDPHLIFSGLRHFLDNVCSYEEEQTFCNVSLPCIVERALDVEDLISAEGIQMCASQSDARVEIRRLLAASVLASSFLCLFPWQPCRNLTRQNINFDEFFSILPENPEYSTSLWCVIHYFERLASDPGGPVGSLIISVQVTPACVTPTITDWRSCNLTLCPLEVKTKGTVSEAGPQALQLVSRSGILNGPLLCSTQGVDPLCCCPELIAALLFVDAPLDTEAVIVQGCETYVSLVQPHASPHNDSAKRNRYGNLESALCTIEAPSDNETDSYYHSNIVLRDITKVFSGCQQRELQPLSSDITEDDVEENDRLIGAVGGMIAPNSSSNLRSSECHSMAPPVSVPNTLSFVTRTLPSQRHDLVESPVTSHSVTSCDLVTSGFVTTPDIVTPDNVMTVNQANVHLGSHTVTSPDLPKVTTPDLPKVMTSDLSKVTTPDCATNQVSSSGEEAFQRSRYTLSDKQVSVTLPAVTVPRQYSLTKQTSYGEESLEDRRRSSNLSDITSRRSSSSTSSSRRSSGKRSSSEFSSEFEEYYDTFQRQERRLKPIAIEEEDLACLSTLHESAEIHSTDVRGEWPECPSEPVRPTPSRPPLHLLKKFNRNIDSADFDSLSPEGESIEIPVTQDDGDANECLASSARASVPLPASGGARPKTTHYSRRNTAPMAQSSLHRHQPGIIHFVDNLVNHASEESRLRLQRSTQVQAPSLSLDLVGFSTEAAPVAPLHSEAHFIQSDTTSHEVPTRLIQLKEESPPAKYETRDLSDMTTASRSILVTESRSSLSSVSPSGSPSASVSFSPQLMVHSIPGDHHPSSHDHDHLVVVLPHHNSMTLNDFSRSHCEFSDPIVQAQEDADVRTHHTAQHCNQHSSDGRRGRSKTCLEAVEHDAVNQYANTLSQIVMSEAFNTIRAKEATSEKPRRKISADSHRKLMYYAECLSCSIVRRATQTAANELAKLKRTPSTMCSSEENLIRAQGVNDYAQDFIHDVLEESFSVYQQQYQPMLSDRFTKSVEELRVSPSPDDSIYFAAEFNAVDASQLPSGSSRRSSHDFFSHRRRSSGFKSSLLSDFEHELIRSNVSTPSLLEFDTLYQSSTKRRASEPATVASLDSLILGSQRGRSSPDIASSSREFILDWLEECSSVNRRFRRRRRTTSSHLEWFTQDLLVDIFNDAFLELFGENYLAYWEMSQSSQRENIPPSSASSQTNQSSKIHVTNSLKTFSAKLANDIIHQVFEDVRKTTKSKSRKSDSSYSHIEMIADSFAWQVIGEAQELLRREIALNKQSEIGERVVAMDSLGVTAGNSHLRSLLQWAAASRAGAPRLIYFTLGNPELTALESLARTLRHQLFTVGELMTVIFNYCDTIKDSSENQQSLFDFLRESSI